MGPCPFRHGYAVRRQRHQPDCKRFNGAMPFQAWIRRQRRTAAVAVMRFNGAMPFQAWILACEKAQGQQRRRLQWGHALSGMDTVVCDEIRLSQCALQWGHALSGMDTFSKFC